MAEKLYDAYHQEIELTSEQEACLKYSGGIVLFILLLFGMLAFFLLKQFIPVQQKNEDAFSESIVDLAPDSIPEYAGKDYIELSGNKPNFTEYDFHFLSRRRTTTHWQRKLVYLFRLSEERQAVFIVN